MDSMKKPCCVSSVTAVRPPACPWRARSGPPPRATRTGSGAATGSSEGTRIRLTSAADHRNVRALNTTTTGTPIAVTRRPPIAGPTKKARLSMVLAVPFAAVSSSGVFTSFGVRAATAGRNGAPTRGARVASTNTVHDGASAQMRPATAEQIAALIRSVLIMTILRGSRSTRVEANGVTIVMSTRRTVNQMPTARAPPTSYTQMRMAVA